MPTDIFMLCYQIFKDFGENAVLGGVTIFLLWKLGSNHLRHIGTDIKTCINKIDTLSTGVQESQKETNKKIDAVNSKVELLESKTAKIEGKIGI